MTAAYGLARARRLLLLLTAAARAARRGAGVPLARAVELTGARSEKQVTEDVAALSSLWVEPSASEDVVDLYVEDGQVFVTYALAFGSPPAFSLAEGAVLQAVLAPFERDGGRAVKEVLRKLRRAVPEVLRPEADRLAHGLDLAVEPPGPWAGALQGAIDRRSEVVVEYGAVGDDVPRRRTVEPRLLFLRDGHWYLAAWNVERAAEHLFRLDRIASVEPGTRVFGEHKGPPVSRYGRRNLYFESGAEREVTVRFRGIAAALARQRHGSRARAEGDGTTTVAMRLTPGNYLFGVVLGYGGEATLTGPPDVVESFRARVAELAARYS